MYKRPKQADLYGITSDFWQKGSVRYVAHAITNTGRAILLRKEQNPADGNIKLAKNHPDRKYWELGITRPGELGLGNNERLARIEIDCSLMPCDGDDDGCVFTVPPGIEAWGYQKGLELRVFAHRNEGEGDNTDGSARRYFRCKLGDGKAALQDARRNGADGWNWKAWLENEDRANPYP
ncbi:hypothetical protein [Luteibacter sp.]|jgi:hypothetical protein|uniref:hypothetical protein n=1 Tax=Luteibacter sp. TaxID=1886636 RepID=UPI002F40D006